MKLLLVRHGESTWNAQGRYQGQMDPALSERGIRQARALARHVAAYDAVRPAAVVASPLSRARGTAEIVCEGSNLVVESDDRLIEISHGEWEGLLKTQVEHRWPEMIAAWRSAPETVVFPGGESLADVLRRWRSFLSDAGHYPSPLMIVTHDVIVRLAVLDARRQPLSSFNSLAAENAAITQALSTHDGLRLVSLNDRSFLGQDCADAAAQAL